VLVGFDGSDDAAVYRISDELAMIQTVDFFPPVVDDPYTFGQVAAANALSDVYAMGGKPVLAMNLLSFPSCLGMEIAGEILAGGADKVREAGAVIAGGHSIEDKEPKYGLCVTGFARPDEIWRNDRAQEGDLLILTKPLGTGLLATALKAGELSDEALALMTAQMCRLNKYAAEAVHSLPVSACTDVTGFGLLGHALEMARGSGVTAVIRADAVPALPGALNFAEEGFVPGGSYRNHDFLGKELSHSPALPDALLDLLCDPQTSGGLLLSIPEHAAPEALERIRRTEPQAAIVGRITARGDTALLIE